MPRNPGEAGRPPSLPRPRLATALRARLAEGYGSGDLRKDLVAGLVVGIMAIPLSMALAIASGVPPQHGLYTAVVAGGLIATLGGSRLQVSGPTAAFVVILAPITATFGLAGLAVATVMAGLIQLAMGWAGLGRMIRFVPYPVTTGFTAGIAVVIATLQIKDFCGLTVPSVPDHWLERMAAFARALPTLRWSDLAIGALTLTLLGLWPRTRSRLPAPLVALALAALAAHAIELWAPGEAVATIRSRFGTPRVPHGIPQVPPLPGWPWHLKGPGGGSFVLDLDTLRSLVGPALAIAILGAIESLLSAVVADGMSGTDHDPDAELMAQGTGNLVVPFFGGFAATGALARTAANIRFGASSPLAAVFHAGFVLLAVLLFAPLLGHLPMAGLAALLLRVAWNMSEAPHFVHAVRVAPKSDVLVLLTCFGLTVLLDMVVAVAVGIVLSSLLFMRRMAALAEVQLLPAHHPELPRDLPEGVLVYAIAGPLFFGAAQKAMGRLRSLKRGVHTVIIDMRAVPVLDLTGLVNLRSLISRLADQHVHLILAGVQPQPLRVLARSHLRSTHRTLTVVRSLDTALARARRRAPSFPEGRASPRHESTTASPGGD